MSEHKHINIVPIKFTADYDSKIYLFQAPLNEMLYAGDYVRVHGNKFARVVATSLEVREDFELYKWLLGLMGATHPLKKIEGVCRPMIWHDDDVIPFE